MSSADSFDNSSSSSNTGADDDGLGFKKALVVVGAVLGFIVFLLFLRFGCNVAIDVCILCDLREARRTLADLRDSIFFWRRRVAPEHASGQVVVTVEQQQVPTEQDAVERLLQGLPDTERSIVISTLLKGMPVEKQDLHQWKQRYNDEQQIHGVVAKEPTANSADSPSKGGTSVVSVEDSVSSDHHESSTCSSQEVSCSICLHDLQVDHTVFVEPNCQHVFHRDCIVEWCTSTRRTSCPYCRQSIITQAQLQAVLEMRSNNHHHHHPGEEA